VVISPTLARQQIEALARFVFFAEEHNGNLAKTRTPYKGVREGSRGLVHFNIVLVCGPAWQVA